MLTILQQIAKEAGKIIEEEKKKNYSISVKSDHTLLTEIDLKVNDYILSKLKDNFPDIPILSEESIPISGTDTYFAVDPIDGTAELVANRKDPKKIYYAVVIAFVEKGVAQMGVVYQSEIDVLYHAELGKGAYKNNVRIFTKKSEKLVIGP